MPEYRFGTGNTHIRAKLKNFDWSLDKDRSKLWDTKYGGLAPQVLLKPGWRGNFFTGGKDGEVQVRRLPQERSWLASATDFYEKGSEENSSETQNSNTNQEHRVHSARGKGGSPRKRGMNEELFRDYFIPDSFFCSPQSKFQEAPWRLTFRKYCKTRWGWRI